MCDLLTFSGQYHIRTNGVYMNDLIITEELLREFALEEKKIKKLTCVKCEHPEVTYVVNKYMGYCTMCAEQLGLIEEVTESVNPSTENMAF